MTDAALAQALENIYSSLSNDNAELDTHIAALKKLLAAQGTNEVEVDTSQLAQQNRQGRKMMQSYFKQRGVVVTFTAKA